MVIGIEEALALSLTLLDPVGQFGDLVEDCPTLGHEFADFSVGVNHRGVVTAAKFLADLWQGHISEFPQQVHGDLPCCHQSPGSGFAVEFFNCEIEVLGSLGNDRGGGDFLGTLVGDQILQDCLGKAHVNGLVVE